MLSAAEGGTVFFDEVGDLPLATQVKMLRLLQQREYEPLGGTKAVKADIRVVAASNKDLRELVAQGKFRDDLYFRLAVVKFELPPLMRRREDVPYLVDHFIKKFNARKGKRILGVSPEVMGTLMSHDYPGNIRELENIIEYCFVLCHGSVIKKEHLPVDFLQSRESTTRPSSADTTPVTESLDEHARITSAMEKHNGNISKVAEEMGIHRTTLWRKLKRYRIDRDQFKK